MLGFAKLTVKLDHTPELAEFALFGDRNRGAHHHLCERRVSTDTARGNSMCEIFGSERARCARELTATTRQRGVRPRLTIPHGERTEVRAGDTCGLHAPLAPNCSIRVSR